jgi:hypothetical protein
MLKVDSSADFIECVDVPDRGAKVDGFGVVQSKCLFIIQRPAL